MFRTGLSRSCSYRTRLHLSTLLHVILFTFIFFCKVDGMKKLYVENESKKVPIVHIEGVLGHRVEMPCDIIPKRRDDSVYMVLWFRESAGKPLYSFDARGRGLKTAKTWSAQAGFDERAAFQAGSYPAHLLVNDLHEGDQGVYRCRVDFRYSPTRNALVNLTVAVPPTPPIIYDDLGREISSLVGPYVEGSDVKLKCAVSGGKPDPVVSWYVNGELEDSTYHVNRFGEVINELAFRGLNRSHLGSHFSCRASNTRLIQPVEKSVVLDLNLKPLFVRMRQKQAEKLVAGKEYRLVCETAGSKPPAILKWIKGGKEITHVSTQDLDAGNITQSTFLFIPTPHDNGASIICRAENPWLNRSHILEEIWNLNVVYQPEVKLTLGSTLNPAEIKEGTDVYFECKIYANPRHSRLIWLFNDEELKHTPAAGIIMSNQSLVLQGINRKSGGNYTCIATNAEGSTPSNVLHLNVMYAPVCLTENGVTVGAAKGENVALRCAVAAYPTAFRFEWEFHGTGDSVDVVALGKTQSHGNVSRFFYTPQSDSDFGAFLCWASNDIGRQVQPCVFHVVAAVKPLPLENCTVVNQTATFIHVECSSHREPPPIPDQPLFRIMNGDGAGSGGSGGGGNSNGNVDPSQAYHHDPAQYGIFPEYYVMEVWDLKNRSIRRNLSAEAPVFMLKGLAPGSWLRLVLYAANSHGKSEPQIIEAVTAGDAEKHTLGARKGKIELFPLVAMGIGLAFIGTILVIFVAMLFRSRFSGASHRGSGPSGNSHCEKPNSMMLSAGITSATNNTSTSATGNNTSTTNNSSRMVGGYRPIPQSKNEADANPDIIPDANSFSTDYKEELKRNLTRKGLYIPTATSDGDVQENGVNNSSPNTYLRNHVNSTLPRPHQHNGGGVLNNGGNGGIGGGSIMNGNGSYNSNVATNNSLHMYSNQFNQPNHHPQHNPYQTLQHYHHHRSPPPIPPPAVHPRSHPPPASQQLAQQQQQSVNAASTSGGLVDFANEYIGPVHSHHHQQQIPHHPPNNDYNTVYIRDKLLLDSDIPESCV